MLNIKNLEDRYKRSAPARWDFQLCDSWSVYAYERSGERIVCIVESGPDAAIIADAVNAIPMLILQRRAADALVKALRVDGVVLPKHVQDAIDKYEASCMADMNTVVPVVGP